MTGRVASEDAGPAVVVSFIIAGFACMLAAFCYSEFAAMAPVAGSAYTYTYATLGEIWAWIIGWDLILEYAMSCSVVAAHWSHYLDEFLWISFGWNIPPQFLSDPFTPVIVDGVALQAYVNLPAILVMLVITTILVIGIRESALTNAALVIVKLVVVLFVIVLGWNYVKFANWTSVPVEQRKVSDVADYLERNPEIAAKVPEGSVSTLTTGKGLLEKHPEIAASLDNANDWRSSSCRTRPRSGACWACWESNAGCSRSMMRCAVRSFPTASPD